MNLAQKIKNGLNDNLATFKWFERTISCVCITIPLLLRITDWKEDGTNYGKFRSSISDYVYMHHSYVFGLLLTVAAMLFIFNGAVYFKNEDSSKLNLNKNGKWYNVALGIFLICIIILPHNEYTIPHYIFAGPFFIGNALVTGLFHEKKNRTISIVLAILTVASLGLYFSTLFPAFTLFWAEWISLTVIGAHFILESRK